MTTKNYSIPVSVNRYIYHISDQCNKKSILKNGLRGNSKPTIGYYNAVFAHNCNFVDVNWFPLVLDDLDCNFWCEKTETEIESNEIDNILDRFKYCYDIWRIDTTKLGKQWFRDNIGEKEFEKGLFRPENLYVVVFGDIPEDCIELVKLEVEFTRKHFNWGWVEMRTLSPVA